MVCLPNSLDICLHVLFEVFPCAFVRVPGCNGMRCLFSSCVFNLFFCVFGSWVRFGVIFLGVVIGIVCVGVVVWGSARCAVSVCFVGSLLGCFVSYVEQGGLFLCMVWLLFLGMFCMVCVREYG